MPRNKTAPLEASSPRYLNNTEYDEIDGQNYGQKFEFDPSFEGPVKSRSCTDVICLLLFLVFLGGWGFVAYLGISSGDIEKVLYPTDSRGRICGKDDLKDKPFLLFFDLTRCLNPAVLSLGCSTPQVCVTECPKSIMSGFALAQSGQNELAKASMKPFCQGMSQRKWNSLTAMDLIRNELCPAWVLPSQPVLGRCLPIKSATDDSGQIITANQTIDNTPINGNTLTKALSALGGFLNVREFGERVFNDLSDTWWMIGLAYIGCTVLSFIWILIMRWFAGFMVWTSITLIFVLVSGLLGYSTYRYLLIRDLAESQGSILTVNFTPDYLNDVLSLKDTWLAFVIILAILAIIIVLVLIALRQRIQIAIELIEEGSKSVGQNLSTIFFPIIPFILHVVVAIWFAVVAMYLSSSGNSIYKIHYEYQTKSDDPDRPPPACGDGNCISPATGLLYQLGEVCDPDVFNKTCRSCPLIQCQFNMYEKSTQAFWLQWYNLFAFYWAMNFVTAFGEIVLAGVFATWYWTWEKTKVPCCILGQSMGFAIFFHLGTIAFGSLIIAIIKLLRAILSYIEGKLATFNNDLTKCLLCTCKCCLWCLENFLKFINRNAYIICAIKSTNFCSSAKTAFDLLMRNILRVLVLNKVVDFLLLLGKLVIVTGVGTMSYFVFSGQIPDLKDNIPTLNYFFMPIIFIVIGSYLITCSFFGVYAMAVDTLFLCFLEDLERNDGTPGRPYFMSRNLQKVVGRMQKFNDQQPINLRKRN